MPTVRNTCLALSTDGTEQWRWSR